MKSLKELSLNVNFEQNEESWLKMLDSRGQVQITDTYYSPAVNICAVIFIVPTVLGVGGRIFTKKAFVRKVNQDDYVILAALVSDNIKLEIERN